MKDPVEWAKSVAAIVKDYCGKTIAPLVERLNALEQRQPEKGERGEKGEKGDQGEQGPPGNNGLNGKDGKNGAPGERGEAGQPGRDGIAGKDGRDGIDGKDGAPGPRGEKGERGNDGINGKDGRDGVDGKSFTIEDVRELLEAEQAKWALEFERRAQERLDRFIERIEKPKDGKDGRDALELENFEFSLDEDGRTLSIALIRGDTRVERSIRLPHVIYRGVWKQGDYTQGDSVTFGGSQWIAMRDTSSKPETDDSWRLAVKRGRDGKDRAA